MLLQKLPKNASYVLSRIDASELAQATKDSMKSRIRTLYKQTSFPNNALAAIDAVNKSGNSSTRLTLINTVLSACRLCPELQDALGEQSFELLVLSDRLKEEDLKRRAVCATRLSDVSWEYLESLAPKFEQMDADSQLLFHLYVMPGCGFCPRVDFTPMRIVEDFADVDRYCNFYVRETNEIVLQQYKTSSRYGRIVVEAPSDLRCRIPVRNYMFETKGRPMAGKL